MISNDDVITLAETVTKLYEKTATRLLINTCRHFGGGQDLPLDTWAVEKSLENGKVIDESISIINQGTAGRRKKLNDALFEAAGISVDDIDNLIAEAKNKGIGFPDVISRKAATEQIVEEFLTATSAKLDAVNVTMLNSTAEFYSMGLAEIQNLTRYGNASIVGTLTGGMPLGKAKAEFIKKAALDGITAFYDSAGRRWSAEAYTDMLLRTAIHNTAVNGQKARATAYGQDVFQVSTKNAARPQCAPYQGRFYSWNNRSGIIEDLYGNRYFYEPISSTTYQKEPAGLFGINCGHNPITFINGFSIPRYKPLDEEQEASNEKQYRESQQQRHLERKVRNDKTILKSLEAAGADPESITQYSEKVKQNTAAYKAFCEKTGRTPRNDRLRIY